MAILDSSFLIDIMRKEPAAVQQLFELESKEPLRIPAPVIMELWHGALRSKDALRECDIVDQILRAKPLLDFAELEAKRTAQLNVDMANPLKSVDAMIAATALVHDDKLVTADADFARVPGLRVLKY